MPEQARWKVVGRGLIPSPPAAAWGAWGRRAWICAGSRAGVPGVEAGKAPREVVAAGVPGKVVGGEGGEGRGRHEPLAVLAEEGGEMVGGGG